MDLHALKFLDINCSIGLEFVLIYGAVLLAIMLLFVSSSRTSDFIASGDVLHLELPCDI